MGVGKYYQLKKEQIFNDYGVIGIYDNDIRIIGTNIDSFVVMDAKKLSKGDNVLIASPANKYVMVNQILEQGIEEENISFVTEDWMKNMGGMLRVSKNKVIFESFDGVSVYLDNEFQEAIFRDIFVNECYNYNCTEPYIVIDIGVNAGFASLFFAYKDGVAKVYGYEPDGLLFKEAQINIKLNPKIEEKVEVFPYALANGNRVEKYVNIEHGNGVCGIRKIRSDDNNTSVFEIDCVDVADELEKIVKKHPTEKILLKIDCEGAEYEIFERLENTGWIDKIDAIVMEWHLGKRGALEAFLSKHRFAYIIKNTTEQYGLCYAQRCM